MKNQNENWNLKQIGGWKGFVKQLYRHHKPDGGALILRVLIGVVFIMHGWSKADNMAGTIHFFGMLGFSPFMAYFVSWLEIIGGALLVVGLFIKPICVALAVDMAVVVWGLSSQTHGFFWGHELEFILLVTLLAIYVMGPGRYSLARMR